MPWNLLSCRKPMAVFEAPAAAPEVSVIVIFLNERRFLQDAIDSVFAQTFRDWELLLVDDGSTDGSQEIARRTVEQYPGRVRCLEHPDRANRGRSAARNLGIRNARGEYLALLDGDDVWLPRKLERQLVLMRSQPHVGMVYGSTQLWYSWTGDPLDFGRDLTPDLGVPLDVPLGGRAFLPRMLERRALAPCTCSMLLRREVVKAVHGFEEIFRGMHDDQAFTAKVCLSSGILASGECWDRYRQRPDSCYSIARSTGEHHAARRFFLEWLEDYVRANRIEDRAIREALSKELHASRRSTTMPSAGRLRNFLRRRVPLNLLRRLRSGLGVEESARAPRVDFGGLRRLTPISRRWGKDRGGQPIDRYYVERFLAQHRSDIRGRVLEVGDDTYTIRFGAGAVERRDVLNATPGNPLATFVADLARGGDGLPTETFDCVILTQVLHVIGDPRTAVETLGRILRPGGVVLATFPGISQISRWDMDRWGDYWRFTTLSARRLFASVFPPEQVNVASHGNVLAAVGFLHGLAAEDLLPAELEELDPDYQVLITVRAERSAAEPWSGTVRNG